MHSRLSQQRKTKGATGAKRGTLGTQRAVVFANEVTGLVIRWELQYPMQARCFVIEKQKIAPGRTYLFWILGELRSVLKQQKVQVLELAPQGTGAHRDGRPVPSPRGRAMAPAIRAQEPGGG
jgi:hypothetical protein